MRVAGTQDRTGFLEKGHFDKHFMYDIQKRGSAGKKNVFFLQDTLKTDILISNEINFK